MLLAGCKPAREDVRFAVFGHSQQTAHHPGVWEALIDSVNAQKTDYVFILGDVLWVNTEKEWTKIKAGLDRIEAPWFITPGNHDVFYNLDCNASDFSTYPAARAEYLSRFGYFNRFFKDDFANYLLLNSCDSFPQVQPFLDSLPTQIDTSLPVLLFSHHFLANNDKRKWNNVSWSKKAMNWDEIGPKLEKIGVETAFSGDWAKGFEDFEQDGVRFVKTGIGVRGDPVYFSVVTFDRAGKMNVERKFVEVPENSGWKSQ